MTSAFARLGRVPAVADAPVFRPNLVTAKLYESWAFYTERLGFRTLTEWEGYVHLVHPSGPQLGLLLYEQDGQHPELIPAIDGRGLWFSLEVPDADAVYAQLRAAGDDLIGSPEEHPPCGRTFAVRDPNGVLIRLTQRRAA
ncbi:MAG: VOC family protein [Opitutae bacterium]|nr:VOC family protein [Opitutae bacterium]